MAAPDPLLTEARSAVARAWPALLLLSALQLATALAMPAFMLAVFDMALSAGSAPTLAWLFGGLAVAMAVAAAADALRNRALVAAGGQLAAALAGPAFQAARRAQADQPLRDLEALRGFLSSPSLATLLDAAWAPACLLLLALVAPSLGAYALGAAALVAVVGLLAERLGRGAIALANETEAHRGQEVAGAVHCAEAVLGLGLLPALQARWRAAEGRALALAARAVRQGKAWAAAARSLRLLASGGMVALGAMLVLEGRISVGAMIAGNLLLARVLLPLESAAAAFRPLAEARATWRRLAAALAAPPAPGEGAALPRPRGVIRADRVVHLPPGAERPVLRGISFTVQPGEVLGVIGPSGSGKSTLLRLVAGLEAPGAGALTLDGYATALWDRRALGPHLGYLPQLPALPDASVATTIARLGDAPPAAVIAAAKAVGLHAQIAALPHGYATPLGASGFLLSGGQRQRLALARALFGDPAVVLLDEPDAQLDTEGEAMLAALLGRLRARGAAVVMTTHRPALAAAADRLLVLNRGLVERSGPAAAVLAELGAPALRLVREAAA